MYNSQPNRPSVSAVSPYGPAAVSSWPGTAPCRPSTRTGPGKSTLGGGDPYGSCPATHRCLDCGLPELGIWKEHGILYCGSPKQVRAKGYKLQLFIYFSIYDSAIIIIL